MKLNNSHSDTPRPWPQALATAMLIALLAMLLLFTARLYHTSQESATLNAEFVRSKDLFADIFPPPLYIVESYAVVHELRDRWQYSKQGDWRDLDRLDSLQAQFERGNQFWIARRPDSLLDSSSRYAHKFFDVAKSQYVPALRRGDVRVADSVLAEILKPTYHAHRRFIDRMVVGTDTTVARLASRLATIEADRRHLLHAILAMLLAGAFTIAALLLHQRRETMRSNQQLLEMNQRLKELSLVDNLTGLFNRHYFEMRIVQDLAYAKRKFETQGVFMGFLILDVDFFKKVNDTYGHPFGDQVLKEFSARIAGAMRTEDSLVRWGGEEFVLAAVDTSLLGLRELANRILSVVRSTPFEIQGVRLTLTCSVGFCHYPFTQKDDENAGWEEMIARADAALYEAKHRGRNQAVSVVPDRDGNLLYR